MATTAGTATFEILVASPAAVVSAALDGSVFDVAGRANLAAIGGLAHERFHLGERALSFVDVTTVAGAAVDLAIVVERKFGRAVELGQGHVLVPGVTRIHHEPVVAGETHARRTRDVLFACRQLGELLNRRDWISPSTFEITNLHRVAGSAVEGVGSFLGDERLWRRQQCD
jgi:hypothetical protein